MSSHLDEAGRARMVDISEKHRTARTAAAEGTILVSEAVLAAIRDSSLKKGDALAVARIAGVMAAKNTPRTIPLCHDIGLTGCEVAFEPGEGRIRAVCRVKCMARTGAEMEALCGVTAALLALYDMAKSIDKEMEITGVRLLSKTGGKSGDYAAGERRPGKIEAICLSAKRGTPKTPRPTALVTAGRGLADDAHAGDWHRQISLLPLERIEEFRQKGAAVSFGDFGENLVVSGLDFAAMRLGDKLRAGGAELEITQFGKECHSKCHIFETMGDCIMPRCGVFARVVRSGEIHVGDEIVRV